MKKLIKISLLMIVLLVKADNESVIQDQEIIQQTRGFSSWASLDDYQRTSQLITQKHLNNATAASGVMVTLNASGRYYLGGDVTVDPQYNNVTCIKITASNVTLDLRGYTLFSTRVNGGSGTIGVEVAANLSNIKIINGTLSGMHGTAVKINTGTTRVCIENVFIDNCTLVGITVGANCNNFTMIDSTVTRCDGSHVDATDGAVGLRMASLKIAHFERCIFSLNERAGAGNSIGAYITGCTRTNFIECEAHCNKAGTTGAAYGFRFDGAVAHIEMIKCSASSNNSQNGAAYGFSFEGITSGGGSIIECSADGNSALGGDAHGFSFSGGADDFLLEKCGVHNNTSSNNSYGFKLSGCSAMRISNSFSKGQITTGTTYGSYGFYSTGGRANSFEECSASSNKGGSNVAAVGAGFCLAGNELYTQILHCKSKANNGNGGAGYGIYLQSASQSTIRANEIFVNYGAGAGYGICDAATSSISCYMENMAYGNGSADGLIINNYDVKLSPNDTVSIFPVREAFLTDYTNLKMLSFLDNIELIEKVNVTALR